MVTPVREKNDPRARPVRAASARIRWRDLYWGFAPPEACGSGDAGGAGVTLGTCDTGAGAMLLLDTGAAGAPELAGVITLFPSGPIVTVGAAVSLIAAFCFLPSVPRFNRVSLALAALKVFCSDVRASGTSSA